MPIVLDGTNGINTPDLESAGPVTGTTGTFSGAVSGTTGTFSGAVQASGVATNIYPLVAATAVASTSGTSIDFTGIPAWVRRITVMFSGVSTNGSSAIQLQIGAGSFTTTGYASQVQQGSSAVTVATGFGVVSVIAASIVSGSVQVSSIGSNTWVESGNLTTGGAVFNSAGSSPSLSGSLDRIRITTVNGTDTFDAGSINILYE